MRKFTWLISLVVLINISCTRTIDISEIKCDQKNNPAGVGKTPQFSWILSSEERNQSQTTYRILVADDESKLRINEGNIWDSEKVTSCQSLSITYAGNPLEAGKTYFWKVKVWDKEGSESSWSEVGKFVTALFDLSDWSGAKWIGLEDMPDSLILFPGVHPWRNDVRNLAQRRPIVPLFRKEFVANKKIQSALLFVTGLGHYKAYINGAQISEDFLSPGWTNYQKRCLYNTYDITEQIKEGENAIGVIVGNGFHNVNNERYHKLLITFGMPKMICKIKISYTDGSEDIVISDAYWKTAPSPITYSSLYGGESYDAQLEHQGWNQPGFDDINWQQVLIVKDPGGKLEPETAYPLKVNETFKPVEFFKLATDTYMYVFGQNASGIVRIKVKGKKGQTLRIWPGELEFENNYVNQRATGRPHYYEYTLKGDEEEIYQPYFTMYGLRYAQVENAVPAGEDNPNGMPEVLEIDMLHTYNSTPRLGEFSCSNELFNRINKLILYAIQSNTHSVITDCPHREKLGWLEQTYLMGGSIHYNYDIYQLYKKLVNDMMDSQKDSGMIPSTAPEYVHFGYGFTDIPEWGSAGIILPWLIYQWYGDKSVMEEAWPMMERYIEYLKTRSNDYIISYGLGDWYDLGPNRPGFAQLTPYGVTNTATYYYDVQLMAKMALLMDKSDEADSLLVLGEKIKLAFNKTFFNPETKVYATGSQTSMAMPLCVGLVNEEDKEAVLMNLVDSINKNNKTLTAGDIGFHYLVEALTQGGESQLFYEMNNRDDVPGYGYQLKMGATSLTESWQALPNVSNNHMMLGHIMEWFYKGLCGIKQAESSVAYKYIVIKPSFVGDITHAMGGFISPYGKIVSEWWKESTSTRWHVEVPVNSKALVYLKTDDIETVQESGKSLNGNEDIKVIGSEDGYVMVEIGSGIYNFSK